MKITTEDAYHLMLNIDVHEGPKAIKVTSKFLKYLKDKYIGQYYIDVYNSNTVYNQFMGIPIELDNTIESPFYELVW